MKRNLPFPSKAVAMTMVSFLPLSQETGWHSHGRNPSLEEKGQGWATALLCWRRRNATVFLRRRGDWPQPSSSRTSKERAGEVVMTVALISLGKGGLPRRDVCRGGGHPMCPITLRKESLP